MKRSTCLSMLIAAGLITSGAAFADNKKLEIGFNNWPENIAVVNMWKIVLEENYDYDINLNDLGKSVIFGGLAEENLDVSMEVWLPTTDAQYLEPFDGKIDIHDAWYEGTKLGIVVPDYVDIDTIPELGEQADAFQYQGGPTIVGINSGSGIAGLTDKAIEEYDLPFRQLNSSDPAMMAALDDAINKEDNLAVTLWSPHWAFASYDLKYLDDPKEIYGGSESIHWISRAGFENDHPWVTALLNAWMMDDDSLGSLMGALEETDSPEVGARQWIEANQDLIDEWIQAADKAVNN